MQLSQKFLILVAAFSHAVIISSAAAPVRPTPSRLREIIVNNDVQAMARYIHDFPDEINTPGLYGQPLIMQAVQKGVLDIVELLIISGANTQVTADDYGIWNYTAHLAFTKPVEALAIAELLHRHKVDGINRPERCTRATPLMAIGKFGGTPELFQLFLEAGADINATDFNGNTVLTYIHNNIDAIRSKEMLAIYHEFIEKQKKEQ